MRTAMENTYASPHWDRSKSTLKIFSAPEFYWRGARGAYRVGVVEDLLIGDFTQALEALAADPKYADWLFIFGTVILAEPADARFVNLLKHPFANISYYNAAPIYLGGTTRRLLEFKHYISGEDFIQHSPGHTRVRPVQAPPGTGAAFCRLHPESNGCLYGKLPGKVARQIGFEAYEVIQNNVFELEGLRIGIEICLDHAEGRLHSMLGPDETVDLHLVTSAGMAIARGPVCTSAGGPVCLSDGFAATSVSLNPFGRGRKSYRGPDGSMLYETGMVYVSTALRSVQQWLGDTIFALTGNGFGGEGALVPGTGASLPGGNAVEGKTGIQYARVSALGGRWREMLQGFFNTANYDVLADACSKLQDIWPTSAQAETPFFFPTVDFYGPLPL